MLRRSFRAVLALSLAACGMHQSYTPSPLNVEAARVSATVPALAPAFKEYPLPDGSAAGQGVVVLGNLWVPAPLSYVYKITSVGTVSPVTISPPQICTDMPPSQSICVYPFADTVAGPYIWVLTSFQSPMTISRPQLNTPQALVESATLFALNPANGSIVNQFGDPTGGFASAPGFNVIQGSDLRVWYPQCGTATITSPTKCYVVATANHAGSGSYSGTPYYTGTNTGKVLASGGDGRLYLTETSSSGAADVARITTSGAVIHHYVLPFHSNPIGIAAGCDGNLWIALAGTNKIARLTLAGAMTQYTIPTPNAGATWITLGVDGNMWFTEYRANKVARITPSGTIAEYRLPVSGSGPNRIMGPYAGNCKHLAHGYLYFAEANRNVIGKLLF